MSLSARIKSTLEFTSILLVIAAASALLWTVYQQSTAPEQASAGPRVESVEGLSIAAASITKRAGRGALALIEFSDFECPFCGKFARDTYPSIRQGFVDNGKLTFVSFAFPLESLHPLARKASEAAECAAQQGKFWEMRERLYADHSALAPDALSTSAKAVGLDLNQFEACLADGEAQKAVQAEIEQGRQLGVNSTPTLFLGRLRKDGSIDLLKRIRGAAPLAQLESAITELSQRAQR
ncbi:MAG TPA: thioredoxin domain-containing protein [Vicinamibacterales bacterium]|nr:thioredoxin domain-containing protein [Vicinamibacterales bacterium]